MAMFRHPLWLAGFRPFFTLACLAGLSLPALWVAVFLGHAALPAAPVPPVQWHAHEMFYGFGWAALGGFLLTATKNWVGIRGYRGGALAFLAAAWLFERAGMAFGGAWPDWLWTLSSLLFLCAAVGMLAATLLRHRASDDYRRDNHFFLLALAAFPLAKVLLISGTHFQAGIVTTTALFRLAFLLMLERTLTQFMKAAFQVGILRLPPLDNAIKWLAVALAGAWLMPPPLAAGAALSLALLLAVRLAFWKPQLALRRLDIGIMYLGYAAIVLQLLAEALAALAAPGWIGTLPVHVFTLGAMGLILPAMLVRIAKGHTGRKVAFEAADKLALWLMIAAFVLRVAAPQVAPGAYPLWLALAAAGWFAAFSILGWRLLPFLWRPRVDGREH